MQDSFAYCENLVREADKDRYLASLFARADRRPQLHALYAFNIEVARVRELAREPMAGEVRLQWWREAIEGKRAGEASAHPVAAALLETIERYGLAAASLLDLVEARAFDLYDDPMPTLAAFEGYGRRTSSALLELAARVLGEEHRGIAGAARPAGIAYAVTGLLRAFALHASRRQLYLPGDLLERHGVRLDDVFAGRATPALRYALMDLRKYAGRQLDTFNRTAAISPQAAPAFLPVALVRLYLDRMERRDYDPFTSPVEVPQWRRQWTLWRAARFTPSSW